MLPAEHSHLRYCQHFYSFSNHSPLSLVVSTAAGSSPQPEPHGGKIGRTDRYFRGFDLADVLSAEDDGDLC